MMIDAAVQRLYGEKFDKNGEYASKGKLIPLLAEELKNHPYFAIDIPKTTGREMFGEHYTYALLEKYQDYSKNDIIFTLTWFTKNILFITII